MNFFNPIIMADTNTALMHAAQYGDIGTVETLIATGVNVQTKDDYGQTALILAAQNGHTAIVDHLIEAGTDIETRDDDEWTQKH